MEIREIPIEDIGLSVRAYNGLNRANVKTVGDMLGYDEEHLYHIRNMGKKSVDEVLQKIAEYSAYAETGRLSAAEPPKPELPETPDALFALPDGRAFTEAHLREKQLGIDALALLPARAFNLLSFHGYTMLHQILFMDEAGLLEIPRMDPASASEIRLLCEEYLRKNGEALLKTYILEKTRVTIFDMITMPEYREAIHRFVQANDRPVEALGLSTRPTNQLKKAGCLLLSDMLLMTEEELRAIPAMGNGSVAEIMHFQHDYLSANEQRLTAYCGGDESVLLDDGTIREKILQLYREMGFGGLSLSEMTEKLQLPNGIAVERIKHVIGSLLAEHELEYVDFRCYRLYKRFADALEECPSLDERTKRILRKRLNDVTMENIGQDEGGLTRERIRQLIKKGT